MTSILLPLHLSFAGLWLGCVLTEVLFERALSGRGREHEAILAALHRRVDLCVEVPAFLGVLATGAALLATSAGGALLHAKIGLGLTAILANVYCVALVLRRAGAAQAGQWATFARLDERQHKAGAVVLLGLVGALGLGLSRWAGS